LTEFVSKGSLASLIEERELSYSETIQFIKDIAAGVSCNLFLLMTLHKMYHLTLEGVLHKDLSARNVLITETGRAKIADFGLAREYENTHVTDSFIGYYLALLFMTFTQGPLGFRRCGLILNSVRWMAPESMISLVHTEKSDVW
jgi:serine/threonine protein kinase